MRFRRPDPRSFLRLPQVVVGCFLLLTTAVFAATGTDLAGKSVDPLQAAAGKPLVLIFVRSDCPIANRYAPTLQHYQSQYANKVQFWLVYPDKDETAATIRKHLQEYGYTMPALRDPDHALVKESQAQITPEVGVFDQHGELVYHGRIDNWYAEFGRARPAPTTHELNDALQAVLNHQKPAVASAQGIGCYISDLQ